jgi:hypothetical protein
MQRMLLLFSLIAFQAAAQDASQTAASDADGAADSAAVGPGEANRQNDAAEATEVVARAQAPAAPSNGVKTMSGMSILGNEEAPKSLVIVPWKSSRLGDGVGVAHALDQTPRAVDKEVFMRELHYYELRSGGSE